MNSTRSILSRRADDHIEESVFSVFFALAEGGMSQMPFMNWSDQLSVSVEALDADHKQLVEIINELYDGMLNNPKGELLDGIFERLVEYTKVHFAREEKFFELTHYPDTERHRQKHEEMTAWVSETQRKYKSGELSAPSMEVAMYLKQWLLNHIVGTDNKYKAHLNNNGIC